MAYRKALFYAFCASLLAACKPDDGKMQDYAFTLWHKTDTSGCLQLWHGDTLLDEWHIPYPVLSLSQGDITADGMPEAAVCVMKSTRHFQSVARRPWLFKVEKGRHIRPLWLGSQLARPLDSLAISAGSVYSIERETDGTCLVARYEQHGFGLRHAGYFVRHVDRAEAVRILSQTND